MSNPTKNFTPEEIKELPKFDVFQYAKTVLPIAKAIEEKYKIPYLIGIAQSSHESDNGNSGLARNHCNLFGITATQSWLTKGKPVANLPTFEFINGKRVEMKREFRKYPDWLSSFEDWATLISTFNIYKTAYQLMQKGDMSAGIDSMGKIYATDPFYARSLISRYHVLVEVEKQAGGSFG